VKIVAALGGNALLLRGETPDSDAQERHVREAAAALAPLADEHELIITHGNGPQVGVLALESASDPALTHPYPFDALVAETQGLIGNWLVAAIERASSSRAVCLMTRTVVDPGDPGFAAPTKFIGPVYRKEEAAQLAADRGWQFGQDGQNWRRVVASPQPLNILEIPQIDLMLWHGDVVVCAGGGGVPVVWDESGYWSDVEAVVDKDLTASLLAQKIRADALLLLTDVSHVETRWGSPDARPIERTTPAALRELQFAAGSMGPKVDAVCRFVEAGGRHAAIGRLEDAQALLAGTAGTVVRPDQLQRSSRGEAEKGRVAS
jgi:carbamate kinase